MDQDFELNGGTYLRITDDGFEVKQRKDNLGKYLNIVAATPTSAQHLANKAYVDAAVVGLTPNIIAQLATTRNIDLSDELEDGDQIDGNIVFAGDIIVIKDQTDLTENGLYTVNVSTDNATKAALRVDRMEMPIETVVYVERGTISNGLTYAVGSSTGAFSDGKYPVYGVDQIIFSEVVISISQNINNYLDIKAAVLVASTININLAAPGSMIDGIVPALGARVLVKDQTNKQDNGIYIYNTATTPMVRSDDAKDPGDIISGLYTFVQDGTVNAQTGWVLTTPNPIIIGTTALIFAAFSSAALPKNLNDINQLSPGLGSVIIGNGTSWTGRPLLLNQDLGDVHVVSAAFGDTLHYNGTVWRNITAQQTLAGLFPGSVLGDIVYYNGTTYVNQLPGAISGVQAYNTNLNTIAGFTQATSDVIVSNGSVWQARSLNLDDLGDVIVTTPMHDDFVIYNGTNWINRSHDLDDHSDVLITDGSLALGEVLFYDGTQWVNQFLDLNLLGDVLLTPPETNDYLMFNGTKWVNAVVDLDSLDDVVISNVLPDDVLYYNGANWANGQTGSTTGVQAWDADLDAIAALAQGNSNVIRSNGTTWQSTKLNLNDITHVLTSALDAGDILYYDGTNFVNADKGSVSGVQAWDADLDIIASLAQGAGNVIRSDGTNWQSTQLNINDIVQFNTNALTAGDVLYYNGTTFINGAKGSASNVQTWDADLDAIAALAQGTSNVIISNGAVWTSAKLTLNNISQVSVSSLAIGNLLYYNGTNFVNAALGSPSNVQEWDTDLDTIAALSQGVKNVIISNGSNWTSARLSLNDINNVVITSPTSKNIIYYDGANFVNTTTGTTSGVQAWDADLDSIAALSQTSNAVIISNGTHWITRTLSLNDITPPTSDYSLDGFTFTDLRDPTASQDVATKAYVDATATSLTIKANAQAASTTNLTATYTAGTTGADGGTGVGATLTNSSFQAAFVIDGYTGLINDRILVKDQTTQTQNGIYTLTNLGSSSTNWVLTRATDFDNSSNAMEVKEGDYVFVINGTLNSGTGWVQTNIGDLVVGTSIIVFTQFSSAGHYTAGLGLVLTGTQFSHNNSGTASGTFTKVTVNSQGHVTVGSNPTTLAGYAITDAQPLNSNLTTIAGLSQGTNRVIISNGTNWTSTLLNLNFINNVAVTTLTPGDILYYNGTNFVNKGPGSISGLQAWDNDLDIIATLSQGTGNVIRSNGTAWQSTKLTFATDITGVSVTTQSNNDVLFYNGTNFVNGARGSVSGVQAWDNDLDVIAALSQGVGNVIRSDGSNWVSVKLSLSDLSQVQTNSLTAFDVLYYNGTNFVNAQTGSTSKVQTWGSNLDVISALSQGTNNVILSNGTNWTSAQLNIGDVNGFKIISPLLNNILYYDGTNFVNSSTGSITGVQGWGSNLDTISALAQGLSKVIRSNGTVWQSTKLGLNDLNNVLITTATTGDFVRFNGTNFINSQLDIVNADIDSAAAIAYSKLNLLNSIVNSDVNSAAAITYSKLNLSSSIVNADVSSAAAIAYSKLNLGTSILNSDVNGSAAIAYSKLNLSSSIVNADISNSAAIGLTKLASLTTGFVLQSNATTGIIEVSAVTNTTLTFLDATTSIQTQLNNKQPLNSNLTTIAGLTQVTGNVIRSNGTIWQSTKLNLSDINSVVITTPVSGNFIRYNGTNFVNTPLDIVNADIDVNAAIAYSKLNLSSSILNSDVSGTAGIVYSKLNLATSILNSDINGTAGIVYSKLSLSNSIVNADVSTTAAIAYSKLNLATSILNSDVSGTAAIAYSKLNLGTSIINSDINATAAIAYSKLNLGTSIVNGDISGTAAIAYSKLAALSAGFALQSNIISGIIEVSSVANTTLAFLDATSSVQTQFNNKQPLNSNLTTIAAFTQTSGNVIRSNGTVWQATTLSLSDVTSPIADFSFNSHKLTNLTNPVNAQDAATKAYVDAAASSLNVHNACQAATTANLTATYTAGTTGADGGTGVGATLTNSGTQTAFATDGYTAFVNDRILIKNQTTQTQNGIYVVTTLGSVSTNWVLTRASDYDNHAVANDVKTGDFTFVNNGTVNSTTGWVQGGNGAVVIGTGIITFTQFSGAGTYTAGTGLTLSGGQFSITSLGSSGTYFKVVVNAQGQIVSGSNPTTLAGYAITDAQGTSANLTVIAGLTQGVGNAILSDGTNWTSRKIILNDITGFVTSTLTTGNILYFNGTNFVNSAPNSTSGVQPFNSNLVTIAALTQSASNVIVSNGTNWANRKLAFATDLSDVTITTPISGNVIYYNGTNWVNGTKGSTSGVQAWDNDLDVIAALSQSSNNVIISNGTNWVNRKVALTTDLSDVIITSIATGNILYYNGTTFVNSAPNSTSGVQPFNSNLVTIAGLTQTSGNVIRSNGTNWQSTKVIFATDLTGVAITTATTNDVIFYNGTNFVNGARGTISGVQTWGANLDVISALSQGTANVIRSNGTTWQSSKLTFATDLTGVAVAAVATNDVLYYNGTNFINGARGSVSGVQIWNANLDTISALSQTTSNVIVSNGTSWTTRKLAYGTDLSDVIITTAVTGNITYYNGTNWVNGTKGSTSGIQAWDNDLDVIAALSQGAANVIRSNGTVWQSTKLSLNDINSVLITSATASDVVYYNGTNFVNGARGTVSGVQAWDADLDTIAALSQGASSVIVSNGTVWGSRKLAYATDLSDVTITTPLSGNVLFYNGTKWVNGATGATSNVQAWDADLDSIAALSQGTANVIRSNGTTWQSAKLTFSTDLTGVIVTTPSIGQHLVYNGTNWANQSTTSNNIYTSAGLQNNIKMWIGTATTTAGGAWTASLTSAGFATIISYNAIAQTNTSTLTAIPLASIENISTTTINGWIVADKATTVVLASTVDGLQFGATGVTVAIQVWGT